MSQSFIHQVRILSARKSPPRRKRRGGVAILYSSSQNSLGEMEKRKLRGTTATRLSQSFIHQVRILS